MKKIFVALLLVACFSCQKIKDGHVVRKYKDRQVCYITQSNADGSFENIPVLPKDWEYLKIGDRFNHN